MDKSERFAILFKHTEPVGVVGGRRGFVDTGLPLVLNDFRNFSKDTMRDRALLKHPRDMSDVGNLNWGKIFWIEGTSFTVVPSEGRFVSAENPIGKFDFFGSQEVVTNKHSLAAILGDPASWDKFQRMHGKGK